MGYSRAGFDVIGIDVNPQPNYPFEFLQHDILDLDWLLRIGEIDAVHASPPCQSFTDYRRRGDGVGEGYPNLIPITRDLVEAMNVPYVIENVEKASVELRTSTRLCGSAFGQDIRRHRLFETNWPLGGVDCNHAWQTPRFPSATNRVNLRRTVEVGAWRCIPYAAEAMGIDWMTNEELSESIPPSYTEFIGRQLRGYILADRGEAAST